MRIESAVIPVAGAGTRMFPVTLSTEKCMLPVNTGDGSRPLIDYMVQDCLSAGVERVIIVTTERGETQLGEYYDHVNATTERQLKRVGKDDKLAEQLERQRGIRDKLVYCRQSPDDYGTAVPPSTAKHLLQGEKHFALMGGDDFVYHPDGTSELGLAMATWEAAGTDHVIMGLPVERTAATMYGVLDVSADGTLAAFDEKPPLERIPANPVVNISRYLLSDIIWEQIDAEMSTERGKAEHYVTHAIVSALAAGQTFKVHPVEGKYLDGGSWDGLYKAGEYIRQHPPVTK